MKINTPVSVGELIDKITILEIKRQMICDSKKLKNILHELSELSQLFQSKIKITSVIAAHKADLYEINRHIWLIEDRIRKKEYLKEFDEDFIDLARDVYTSNDKRFELKNSLNKILNSDIREVKSYESYS